MAVFLLHNIVLFNLYNKVNMETPTDQDLADAKKELEKWKVRL